MFKQRWFWIAAFAVMAIGLLLILRGSGREEIKIDEGEESNVEQVTSELAKKLGISVAEGVERIVLEDVGGEGASGLATRDYSDGKFRHTILAALPDAGAAKYYEGWLIKGKEGEEGYSLVKTGKLRKAKGGYLLEYSATKDLHDHSKVLVTSETVDDAKPETSILEGSF